MGRKRKPWYQRKYVPRGVELHKFSTELAVQNYVDIRAMAKAAGMTIGAFTDKLIEREIERRKRLMERKKQRPNIPQQRFQENSVPV